MGGLSDPSLASIDGLIDWLRQQRRRDPVSPLTALLAGRKFDEQRIVDIACIDLMERRRMGHVVNVGSYIDEFSCIQEESNLLDLIDAEICVASELGEEPQLDDYVNRFPNLADQIRELVGLDIAAEADFESSHLDVADVSADGGKPAAVGELEADESSNAREVVVATADPNAPFGSSDFSIEPLPSDASTTKVEEVGQHPIDVPEWFVAEQCVASGPGRWLIRGRDSTRGINLALKVTRLRSQLTRLQSDQLLDACELASTVRNPSWVAPRVAAVQQRHLGVIRPWIYATPWRQVTATVDPRTQLRSLACVAFAIASAHQVGATHGGIHSENLKVDHEGKVSIVDAASSRAGIERWLLPASDPSAGRSEQIMSLEQRKQIDVQDLIKTVAVSAVDWDQHWASDLVADLRRIATSHPLDACAAIGQTLVEHADALNTTQAMNGQRSWRLRLARWLTRND